MYDIESYFGGEMVNEEDLYDEQIEFDGGIAVNFDNVSYAYGSFKVLNGLTMTIEKGTIYGLLGASGCGKTTTLRILIGLYKPTKGEVSVFGDIPGSKTSSVPGSGIGYMPQETALSSLLTIDECLLYFAKLNRMRPFIIYKRMEKLRKLLKLPDGNKTISTISGGQKRRVSLAVALLHEPPLLILDEPTSGVDALLRETIWEYLRTTCVKNGQTIIITTHYIEEANSAHRIGFMRKGNLLIEDNPQNIIQRTNSVSLESAFLKLSRDQEFGEKKKPKRKRKTKSPETKEITDKSKGKGKEKVTYQSTILKKSKSFVRTDVFTALLWKNYILFKKNYIFLSIYMLVVPFLVLMGYSTCMGVNPTNVAMAVYNPDSPPLSSKFIIDNIDPAIVNLIHYDTLAEAIDSVKNYETYGIIIFPQNYTQSMQIAMFDCSDGTVKPQIDDDEEDTLNKDLKKKVKLLTQIDLLLDNTNQIMVRTVIIELYDSFKRVADKTNDVLAGSLTEKPIESPVKTIEPPIFGKKDGELRDFYIYGMVILTIFPFSLGLTGVMMIVERKDQVIERTFSSGVKTYQFVLSHVISQVFLSTFQIISAQACVYYVFGYPCNGSIVLALILFLMQSLFGISLSLFVSSLFDNENNIVFIIIGMLIPLLCINATLWPFQGYPRLMRNILTISPGALNTEAIRAVYTRGWGLTSGIVICGLGIPTVWVVLFVSIAIYKFSQQ